MSRVAYVNGRYLPLRSATISIMDRGLQFADGVYEVWSVWRGELLDNTAHFERLDRSLRELGIAPPGARTALTRIVAETVRRNRVRDGIAYLQITRGVAPRDHAFPKTPVAPTLIVTARSIAPSILEQRARVGVRVTTMPDIRWGRCDIKSTALLANVLAKQAAHEAGGYEAWLVDARGFVTEGASSTAWIVDGEGVLRTRPLGRDILPGVTRATLIRLAQSLQIRLVEAAFSVEEARTAREAFMSSASGVVVPIVGIDDAPVGDGRPGRVAAALREAYFRAVADRDPHA